MTSRASLRAALARWARGGFVPVPVAGLEWAIMRVGFAVLVWSTFFEKHPFRYDAEPAPNGIACLVDLSFLHRPGPVDLSSLQNSLHGLKFVHGPGMYDTILVLATLGCLGLALGRGLGIVLPLLTALSVIVRTHFNSQGFIHHGYQLITLVLLGQSLVVWWWHLRKREEDEADSALPLRSYLLYYSQGIVAFSYVVTGLTKIMNSRGLWFWNSKYICIEIIKSNRLKYYEHLNPAHAVEPWTATWLLQHPFAAQLLFGSGFLLECFAFVALRDRRWAFLIGCALIGFHRGVDWLMELSFWNHEMLCLIFLINVPFWIWWAIRKGAIQAG